ncbi:hypothetical protein [Pelomonas aquatica]|jgi:hypothetical protein|uniref:Uncharacterized protein n=1 Tax=Pelomonas aquatica TaxID=431058 RepID=A0A9X4LE60_9BURK|nr:hypothetical protein [Pelomonas aquatica]MCY4754469.1 hypothetical protein [Pelomonas aquatica]MDG0861483.1 hypothetical protein [Pelomonas aquatica]
MSDYAAGEDRVGELEDRLKDAKEVLEPRSAAYQRINDDALKEEDEANPESAPRGEEKCRTDEALDWVDQAQQQLTSTDAPTEELLDSIEQTVELIEAVIRDTPADEVAPRGLDDDDVYAWDGDDQIACTE